MNVTEIGPGFVAEVTGIDLRAPQDAATVAALRCAFARSLVLVLPGQDGLAPEDQVRFCGYFGPLGARSRPAETRREGADAPAEVMFVSNRQKDGRFIGSLPNGEMQFHIDQCYVERPARATCLYGIVVPDEGGDTLFSDLCAAYEALPEDLRAIVDTHEAHNVFTYDSTSREQVAAAAEARAFVQPMVVAQPGTGRRALYVNRLMTTQIVGMDRAESGRVLERLIGHTEDPAIVYRHKWRAGDLLLWDNACTAHARTDFDPGRERHLRRFTIAGERLCAA